MYEIWLVLNIVWEIALGIAPWVIGGALLWLALVVMAARRPAASWRAGVMGAIVVGVVVAVASFFAVPGLSKSSLSELAYWVDWANLLGVAFGFGAIAAAFAWPLLAMRRAA